MNPGGLGSGPSVLCQQWDTMRNPACEFTGVCFERARDKISGGQCPARFAEKTTTICGLRRNFFPRLSEGGYPDLESSRRAGAPARGMWAGRARNSMLWVPPTTHAVQFCVDPEYICITWLSIGKRSISPIFVMGNSAIENATVHRGVLTRTSTRSGLWGRGR